MIDSDRRIFFYLSAEVRHQASRRDGHLRHHGRKVFRHPQGGPGVGGRVPDPDRRHQEAQLRLHPPRGTGGRQGPGQDSVQGRLQVGVGRIEPVVKLRGFYSRGLNLWSLK